MWANVTMNMRRKELSFLTEGKCDTCCLLLKKLCQEINQNSSSGNCHRIEGNIKINVQMLKGSMKIPAITKGSTDGQI